MREFEHPNLSNDWTCPICRTADDKPVILVPIPGTEKGNITEAHQMHTDCAEVVGRAWAEVYGNET